MDIMEATSLSEILLDRGHINVETVPLSGEDMVNDLRTRGEEQGWPWRFALIIGQRREDDGVGGLIVLEKLQDDNYEGLFYPHANCGGGDKDATSKLTAKMIGLLDEWPNEEALTRTVVWFDALRVSNLREDDEFGRLVHEGPTIEPI